MSAPRFFKKPGDFAVNAKAGGGRVAHGVLQVDGGAKWGEAQWHAVYVLAFRQSVDSAEILHTWPSFSNFDDCHHHGTFNCQRATSLPASPKSPLRCAICSPR
jgi:hypothetical protein